MRVGFIGLGTMGKPMAANVLRGGYSLTVYDLNPSPVQELVALGASAGRSPAHVAGESEAVVLMLPSSPHVTTVVRGEEGLLGAMAPGSILVDMSTIDPITTRSLAASLRERGVQMLDAPVSGSSPKAIDGTLTIMVGGPAETVGRVMPLLRTMGEHVIHVGEVGMGEVVKLANNLISAVSMVAVAEAFNLGVKAGADPRVLYDVISKSSGDCWALRTRVPYADVIGESPANRDFAPGFMTDLMNKDMRLILAVAQELGAPAFAAALAQQLYQATNALGRGNRDFSAVAQLYAALNRPKDGV